MTFPQYEYSIPFTLENDGLTSYQYHDPQCKSVIFLTPVSEDQNTTTMEH